MSSKKSIPLPSFIQNIFRLTNNARNRSAIIIVVFAAIGALVLIATQAATPTSSLETEAGQPANGATTQASASGFSGNGYIRFGANVPVADTARRFFTDDVSWNKTATELGISTNFAGYTERMFNYGGASGWDGSNLSMPYDPSTRGKYSIALRDYSVPIYDATKKTTSKRVYWASWGFPYDNFYECDGLGVAPCTGNQSKVLMAAGTLFPWNPAWTPGTGTDRIMMVVNPQTGETWGYYGTDSAGYQCTFLGDASQSGNWGLNVQAYPPYDINDPSHMCMAGLGRRKDIYSISQSTTSNGRGMGIDKLALVVRAEEVRSGTIRHALGLTVYNQMFGPACSSNSPTAPGAGVSCAFSLPPATRVEHTVKPHSGDCGGNTIQGTDANRMRTVPSGMRFRVKPSVNIESWLDERGYSGKKRNTARIIARALVDYGFIAAAETGCGNPHFEFDGMQNPDAKKIWTEDLGLSDTGIDYTGSSNGAPDGKPDYPSGDLMHGLIKSAADLEVVNPS